MRVLTADDIVGINTNMRARLLLRERRVVGERRFADIVIWHLPRRVPASAHRFKYRLAFVVDGVCVLRFENETGKGDHRHAGTAQSPCDFVSLERLVTDFWDAVDQWSSP